MKKIITIVFLFLSLNVIAQSKYPPKKVAESFMERTLIVELDDSYGEKYIDLLKKVFTDWTLTPVEFKTVEEVDAIAKSNSDEYAILSSGDKVKEKVAGNSRFFEFEVFSLAIYLSEKAKKRNNKFIDNSGDKSIMRGPYVYNVSLIEKPSTIEAVQFAFNEMEKGIPLVLNKERKTIEAEENKEKITTILKKTLLIPKESLGMNASEIKAEFDYKFEIKSIEEINTLIKEENTEYTYIKVIFSQNIPSYSFGIIDMETGKILDEIQSMMTSFASLSANSKTTIGKREIKAFNKLIPYKEKKFAR